jgi:uncharacterized repeat protein (TIGR03803 family)
MTNCMQHRGLWGLTGAFTLGLALAAVLLSPAVVRAQDEANSKTPAYSVVHAFTGGSDGSQYNTLAPFDPGMTREMMRDTDGNLYGTAYAGGYFSSEFGPCPFGCGVVFKLDKSGNESVLHAFTGSPDGAVPTEGLVSDDYGNLYGTTISGGSSPMEAGTVFKVDRNGKETVLYSFTDGPDGGLPWSGVIRDGEGNLYGTTSSGGIPDCFAGGCGVVFKLDPSGKETVLYTFTGGADGGKPTAGLTRDHEGNLYGVTPFGGASGNGVVFKVDCEGKETVLYSFKGAPDGADPTTALVRDEQGNFYGTTENGGSSNGGTVYKLDRNGKETVIYNFTGGTDGAGPSGRLLRHHDDLYGVTYFDGTPEPGCVDTCGVVFKLDKNGKFSVLYSFQGGALGSNPQGGLVEDKGALYGITGFGGDIGQPNCPAGCGVVFKLKTAEECDHDDTVSP